MVKTVSGRTRFGARSVMVAFTLLSIPLAYAAGAPANAGKPDFTGVWRHPFDAKGEKDFYVMGRPMGDLSFMMPWVEAEVRRRQAAFLDGHQIPNTSMLCLPAGVPSLLMEAHDLQILELPNELIFLAESDHQVRHVYMNASHPINLTASWYGHSVGHWEGDTLIIDTVGLNDKSMLDPWGTPHSEALHVIERMQLSKDTNRITTEVTLEDAFALKRPWVYKYSYVKARGEETIGEYACAENNKDDGKHVWK